MDGEITDLFIVNDGTVYNRHTGDIVTPRKINGVMYIKYKGKDGKSIRIHVARMVLFLFGEGEYLGSIGYRDGDKTNCHIDNLYIKRHDNTEVDLLKNFKLLLESDVEIPKIVQFLKKKYSIKYHELISEILKRGGHNHE